MNGYVCEVENYNFNRQEIEKGLKINSDEVEKLFAIPIEECLKNSNFKKYKWIPHPGAAAVISQEHETPGYTFKNGKIRVIGWPGYFLNLMLHCMYPDKHDLVVDPKFVWFDHSDYDNTTTNLRLKQFLD